MFDVDDLKSIIMLTYLKDHMLKKIAEVTAIVEYDPGDYIIREGEFAERLYSVLEGRVGLEVQKHTGKRITVDTVTRGRTFGFSSLVDTEDKQYIISAKSLTATKLFTWTGSDLERLFYQDYEMGFLFMKRLSKIIKSRLQVALIQFSDIYSS